VPKDTLRLDNLKNLDFGLVAAAFDTDLQRVVKDLQDRPQDGKKRKVAIIFELVSIDDHADAISVTAQVKSVIPDRISRPYEMHSKQDGRLEFHSESPENPNQSTITDEIARRREERGQPPAEDEIDRELKP